MEEKNKTQQDALLGVAENIQEFLENYWDLPELWKSLAKAGTTLAFCIQKVRDGEVLSDDALDDLVDVLNQYGMILQVLEPLEYAEK